MNLFKILATALLALISMNMDAKKSYIFLADGVEEVEAVATVDALRRAGMDVVTVSTTDSPIVKGATSQKLVADTLLDQVDFLDADWLIVPGGVPGAPNLHANKKVNEAIVNHADKGGRIASICAGPAVVLAPTGILKGYKATCYPGLESQLSDGGATYVKSPVVVDGKIITSEGPGTTLEFAKAIITQTLGADKADEVLSSMLLQSSTTE